MAKFSIKAGTTDVSILVFIQNSSSTTGAGLTGLVYNTSSLVAYYTHSGTNATATQITLATLAAVNSAHSDGGFKEISSANMPGWYRLDLPDAVVATSKGNVVGLMLHGATNMAPCPVEIELTGWDNQDGVRGGLTAMPNAAAGANGGLPLSVDTSGRVDVLKINGTSQTARDIGASVLLSSGTGTGQISLSSGTVTVGTNNDKSGYSLSQSFPFNFASLAITAAGKVTVGTNDDKIGYSLTQSFPTNFASLAITGAGAVTAGTVSDKTGYSLSATQTFDLTGNITGNVSGSVGSVSGNVGGNVAGSVASVTAPITVDGTSELTEDYPGMGDALTLASALYGVHQHLVAVSVAGTTMTVKKRDRSTTARTFTLDDGTTPTSVVEAS